VLFRKAHPRVICTAALGRSGILIRTSIFSLGVVLVLAQTGFAQSVPNVTHTTPHVIVIGFVGGFIKHDNLIHSEVQLAARLRKDYPTGVDVETFESYHGKKAHRKILNCWTRTMMEL
jgi:hypothetical protein